MQRIADFFIELFAGWRVKDQANDLYAAHQKAKSSRSEIEQILKSHGEENKQSK